MRTITVQINNDNALKALQDLEVRHFISIVEKSDLDVPALPGSPLSLSEFKRWVSDAEQTPTVSLNEAKEKWAKKREQLRNLIK